jgi:hypothetical protein
MSRGSKQRKANSRLCPSCLATSDAAHLSALGWVGWRKIDPFLAYLSDCRCSNIGLRVCRLHFNVSFRFTSNEGEMCRTVEVVVTETVVVCTAVMVLMVLSAVSLAPSVIEVWRRLRCRRSAARHSDGARSSRQGLRRRCSAYAATGRAVAVGHSAASIEGRRSVFMTT